VTVTVDLPNAAIKALDVKTSDDLVPHLGLAATMRFYLLGRLSSGAAADIAGNGRVELLDRLAEFGVNSFEQTPQGLTNEPAAPRFIRN
jgi:hypothetical protein